MELALAGTVRDSLNRTLKKVISVNAQKLLKAKALLLLGAILFIQPDCTGARLLPEWSAVQDTEPGRRVRILLYDDRAPDGTSKFDGSFASATSESVTIILADGSTRKFAKRTVRRVSRRRPLLKRTKAWVITGLTATLVFGLAHRGLFTLYFGDDFTKNKTLRSVLIWSAPTWALATTKSSHVMVYNIPRKSRSP